MEEGEESRWGSFLERDWSSGDGRCLLITKHLALPWYRVSMRRNAYLKKFKRRNEGMLLTLSQLNSCVSPELGSFHPLAPASFLLKEILSARQGCFSSHSFSPLVWNLSMRKQGAVALSECLSQACLGLPGKLVLSGAPEKR